MNDKKLRQFTPIHATFVIATLSILGGCGGLSTSMVLGESSADESAPQTDSSSLADGTGRNQQVFAGLTEEENKENARNFKITLRIGELSKLFAKNVLFDEVAAICGIKIWDKCRVGQIVGDRLMNYHPVAFQEKSGGKVHWYPEFFHDKSEPLWAKKAVRDTRVRRNGDTLLAMLEERCGAPLDSKCQVRRVYGQGYVFTVRETGDVIDSDMIREWSADL